MFTTNPLYTFSRSIIHRLSHHTLPRCHHTPSRCHHTPPSCHHTLEASYTSKSLWRHHTPGRCMMCMHHTLQHRSEPSKLFFGKLYKLFKHKKHTQKMSDLANSYVPQVVNPTLTGNENTFICGTDLGA